MIIARENTGWSLRNLTKYQPRGHNGPHIPSSRLNRFFGKAKNKLNRYWFFNYMTTANISRYKNEYKNARRLGQADISCHAVHVENVIEYVYQVNRVDGIIAKKTSPSIDCPTVYMYV